MSLRLRPRCIINVICISKEENTKNRKKEGEKENKKKVYENEIRKLIIKYILLACIDLQILVTPQKRTMFGIHTITVECLYQTL